MKYFRLLTLFMITVLLCGCNMRTQVNKGAQRTQESVIRYVEEYVNNKYDNVTLTYEGREQAVVANDELFCFLGCGGDPKVDGGYEYRFKVIDKETGNRGLIRYIDPYVSNYSVYEEQIWDQYEFFMYDFNYHTYYKNIFLNYFTEDVIKRVYYDIDSIGVGPVDTRRVVVELNLNHENLDYMYYTRIISAAHDVSAKYGNEPVLMDLYVKFNDSDKNYYLGYKKDWFLNEGLEFPMVDDYSDYYGLNDYRIDTISDDEWNLMLKYFNNKVDYYMFKITNIEAELEDDKYYTIKVHNKTLSDVGNYVRISFIYDEELGYSYLSQIIILGDGRSITVYD